MQGQGHIWIYTIIWDNIRLYTYIYTYIHIYMQEAHTLHGSGPGPGPGPGPGLLGGGLHVFMYICRYITIYYPILSYIYSRFFEANCCQLPNF